MNVSSKSEAAGKEIRAVRGQVWLCLTVLLALLWLGPGCRTTPPEGPGSENLAHVEVSATSLEQVRTEIIKVFGDAHYEMTIARSTYFVFERPATGWETFKSNSWGGLAVRVRVSINTGKDGAYLITLDAFYVEDNHDPAMEKLTRVSRGSAKPYQELLDHVYTRVR